MKIKNDTNEDYINAKNKVRNIKVFYIHLLGYIILVALLLYNIYILDENNKYADFFTWFNSITMVAWTIFIAIHAWNVFKGKLFFKKSWEDRKMSEYIEKEDTEETKIWE